MRVSLRVTRTVALGVSVLLLAAMLFALTRPDDDQMVMLNSPVGGVYMIIDSSGVVLGVRPYSAGGSWSLHSGTTSSDPLIDMLDAIIVAEPAIDQPQIWRLAGVAMYSFPSGQFHDYMLSFRSYIVLVCCALLPLWSLVVWCRRRRQSDLQLPDVVT